MEEMQCFVRICLLVFCSVVAIWGQGQELTPESSAGGQWRRAGIMDDPSSTKAIEFFVAADDPELGRSPQIQFICSGDGKVIRVRYFADTGLRATVGDYKNYEMPAISPKVTVNKKKRFSAIWDVNPDRKSANLDKKTIREMLQAQEILVQYRDREENHFNDFFVVGGLDKTALERACGNNGWFKDSGASLTENR